MKILILAEWYYPIGGVEMFVWRLAKQLPADIELVVGLHYVGKPFELSDKLGQARLVTFSEDQDYVGKLKGLLKSFKPDVIHVQSPVGIGLAGLQAARPLKIPVVMTAHQVPQYRDRFWKVLFRPLIWQLYRFSCSYTAALVAPSQTVADLLEKHRVGRPVQVISCGVDTDLFRPGDKSAAREKLGLAEKPTLLFVGRIATDKNLNLLLEATARLKRPDLQVIIAGPEPTVSGCTEALKKQAQHLGIASQIIWPGLLAPDSQELALYYQAADLFIIPSAFETQSIVTMEALASGLPVVASNSGALPELVKEGINGALFKPGSSKNLAQKIAQLLDDTGQRFQLAAGATESLARHSLELVAKQYAQAYRSIAD